MRTLARLLVTLLMLAFLATPSLALTPDEVLPDAALEARARTISAELRCMICQNQSIDDSDAELAKDLRVLVRQRLVAGDTNDEVIAYVVSRYGEFVLLKPRMSWRNAALWATPAVLLIAGGLYMLVASRRRRKDNAVPLTEAEKAALTEALNNDR
ncbi:MAG: cytochrome c-type biogenesis protein [Mesorhizobium sp.]